MQIKERIVAFDKLGKTLKRILSGGGSPDSAEALRIKSLISDSVNYNPWFTPENVSFCLEHWADALDSVLLEKWLKPYSFSGSGKKRNIGIVMAGNIPMVGFHDLMCVLLSGNRATVKCASSDNQLIPAIANLLCLIEPEFSEEIIFTEGLMKDVDAFIATGSNNSGRYFDFYFRKYPHIIRRHRNSIAILSGNETTEQLRRLGEDIFRYFGLGCRSISKIFIPENYDFTPLIQILSEWQHIDNHYKYHNNYDYNKAIVLANGDEHIDGGFFLLKPDQAAASPISVTHYEKYSSVDYVLEQLKLEKNHTQCITSDLDIPGVIPFGKAQKPELWDYADGIDTLSFLLEINNNF